MTVSDHPGGQPPESANTAAKLKGFFAVDRGAFPCAVVGGLNAAVAHLVMARGTGRDNRTTQWSVNAIEKYTGISRPNAKKAVKDLLNHGVWKKLRDGRHPIYEAVPGDFYLLPDDAILPSRVTGIILGISERTIRYHPNLPRVQISRGRYGQRVGDIRKLARAGMPREAA